VTWTGAGFLVKSGSLPAVRVRREVHEDVDLVRPDHGVDLLIGQLLDVAPVRAEPCP
jgi:hypothetical protein